jgi:hypothetical protein
LREDVELVHHVALPDDVDVDVALPSSFVKGPSFSPSRNPWGRQITGPVRDEPHPVPWMCKAWSRIPAAASRSRHPRREFRKAACQLNAPSSMSKRSDDAAIPFSFQF